MLTKSVLCQQIIHQDFELPQPLHLIPTDKDDPDMILAFNYDFIDQLADHDIIPIVRMIL